jgi:hypothetical protein
MFQLGEKVKPAINEMFSPKMSSKKLDLNNGKKKDEEIKALSSSEKASLDPNVLQPEAARMAMVFFGGLSLILVLLIWFVLTCKNNSAKMRKDREEYEEAHQDDQHTELQNNAFGGRHEMLGEDSDEDA